MSTDRLMPYLTFKCTTQNSSSIFYIPDTCNMHEVSRCFSLYLNRFILLIFVKLLMWLQAFYVVFIHLLSRVLWSPAMFPVLWASHVPKPTWLLAWLSWWPPQENLKLKDQLSSQQAQMLKLKREVEDLLSDKEGLGESVSLFLRITSSAWPA